MRIAEQLLQRRRLQRLVDLGLQERREVGVDVSDSTGGSGIAASRRGVAAPCGAARGGAPATGAGIAGGAAAGSAGAVPQRPRAAASLRCDQRASEKRRVGLASSSCIVGTVRRSLLPASAVAAHARSRALVRRTGSLRRTFLRGSGL